MNRLVRTRMLGGVGTGRESLPVTRFGWTFTALVGAGLLRTKTTGPEVRRPVQRIPRRSTSRLEQSLQLLLIGLISGLG